MCTVSQIRDLEEGQVCWILTSCWFEFVQLGKAIWERDVEVQTEVVVLCEQTDLSAAVSQIQRVLHSLLIHLFPQITTFFTHCWLLVKYIPD